MIESTIEDGEAVTVDEEIVLFMGDVCEEVLGVEFKRSLLETFKMKII